ncbi:hypothetical protein SLA2020_528230 [Shorea laevis]
MLPATGEHLEPEDIGGRCDKNDGLNKVFSDASVSKINEDEIGNEVGERKNGKEEEDQFVFGLEVQNDARVQNDGCKVAEETQDEGSVEDVPELSNDDDDEIVLARDNLEILEQIKLEWLLILQ